VDVGKRLTDHGFGFWGSRIVQKGVGIRDQWHRFWSCGLGRVLVGVRGEFGLRYEDVDLFAFTLSSRMRMRRS